MIETTAMTVITPMITPSSVRKLRSLFVVSAPAAMRRVSIVFGCRVSGVGRPELALLISACLVVLFFLLLLDLAAVLDLAQCAEGAGDDLLAFLRAADDLD